MKTRGGEEDGLRRMAAVLTRAGMRESGMTAANLAGRENYTGTGGNELHSARSGSGFYCEVARRQPYAKKGISPQVYTCVI